MKCFRWRCCVNNSFLVFHQGTKHSKTIKHSRFALVFHTVFSCLDPLMKHSNSLFTYNMKFYYDVKIFLGLSTFTKATFYVIYHMRYYVIMCRLFTILEYLLFDPNPIIAIFQVYCILSHVLMYLQISAQ